jgi:hypothetical protein
MAMQRWDDALDAQGWAKKIAEDQRAMTLLWQIEIAMAQVEKHRGNSAAENSLRSQAHAVIESIAAQTPLALRESFLNFPAVREVMENSKPA